MFQVLPQPVQFPHHQRIARLKRFATRAEAGTIIATPRGLVFIQTRRIDAGRCERIPLEGKSLRPITLGDAHIAHEQRCGLGCQKTRRGWGEPCIDFSHEFSCTCGHPTGSAEPMQGNDRFSDSTAPEQEGKASMASLDRLIIHICAPIHEQFFAAVFQRIPLALRHAMDQLLTVPDGEQRSPFYHLKEYPPAATVSSLQTYLQRYRTLAATGVTEVEPHVLTPAFPEYLFKLAKHYSATDLKRFADPKRYTLMLGFLLETRKVLLDHLVQMHDQYLLDLLRHAKNAHEQKHRELRKRQKKAIDIVLDATAVFLDWPDEAPLVKREFWQQVHEGDLRDALEDLRTFKRLEERGYGDLLLARYPSLRKYFAEFLHLPFAATPGTEAILQAIQPSPA